MPAINFAPSHIVLFLTHPLGPHTSVARSILCARSVDFLKKYIRFYLNEKYGINYELASAHHQQISVSCIYGYIIHRPSVVDSSFSSYRSMAAHWLRGDLSPRGEVEA